MNQKTPSQEYLNTQELADWLCISQRTVVNLCRRRVLPHIKIGRLIRFSRAQVEVALKDYTIDSI